MREPDQGIDWNALVLSIHEGDCILMIGPDAITESINGRSISLMQLFSNELISQLPGDHSELASLNQAQVAQVFKNLRDSRDLRSAARDFFGKRVDSTTPSLRALATLPFRLVIDTTPLRLMENAFKDAGKVPQDDWYHKNEPARHLTEEFNDKEPLVYHVFGSIKDLKSLVLAENDLVDLLVSVIKGNPSLPVRLLNAFSAESSMLFLGFGVRHLLLRILLHVLNSGRSTNRSFAIERFDDDVGRRAVEQVKLLFQQGRRIDFIDMELDQFTAQLCDRYLAYQDSSTLSPESVGKTATEPLVFISYCHEDKREAEDLQEGLEKRDIKVWRDAGNLRAGEDWDRTITQVIERDINYFLLLHSKTFVKTTETEGYVINELKCALNRAKRIFKGIFIIPVRMDDAQIVPDLSKFHIIDVRTQAGREQLATDIKRDFDTRKKTVT
jgi:hypothetical protein